MILLVTVRPISSGRDASVVELQTFLPIFCKTNRYIKSTTPDCSSDTSDHLVVITKGSTALSKEMFCHGNERAIQYKQQQQKECFTNFKTSDIAGSFQTRHNFNFTK